jgi:hypothetical protein
MLAPALDDGSGVPQNSTIQNVTNLANAVTADFVGAFRAVNAPPGTPVTAGSISVGAAPGTIGGFSLVTLLLVGAAFFLVFKAVG